MGRIAAAGIVAALIALAATGCAGAAEESAVETTTTESPSRTLSPAEMERQRAEYAALRDPSTYEAIAPRDFALLVKDPDSFKNRKIIVYGVVTQFDAATGTSSFRANTGAEPQARSYDYEQNTIVTAIDPAILSDIVEKDFVTMYVKVAGAYSYDTQLGGETTVPQFWVYIINRTGTAE